MIDGIDTVTKYRQADMADCRHSSTIVQKNQRIFFEWERLSCKGV